MLEFEIRSKEVQGDEFPPSILNSFNRKNLSCRSILAWGEHCTECSIPECFKTCDLYEPRSDRKCRRFLGGIVKINAPNSQYGYISQITFKPLSNLWTPGSTRVYQHAEGFESIYKAIAKTVKIIPSNFGVGRFRIPRAFYQVCKYAVKLGQKFSLGSAADYFLIQVYNPHQSCIRLSLNMRQRNISPNIPFSKLIAIDPGYHEIYIHIDDIMTKIDTDMPFDIDITPNIEDEPVSAYFGIVDFIKYKSRTDDPYAKKKIKCVVWDLDNCLWNGILVENDPANVTLKAGIGDILHHLDERGILLSIASKNNSEMATELLRKFGIEEYFLYPEINWQPKSLSIKRIQQNLNIGLDSISFIDDSNFERAEITESLPEVLCIDAVNYTNLLCYPCMAGSFTEDSKKRRLYYRAEEKRNIELKAGFENDYPAFLKSCDIRLNLSQPTQENFNRINDLIQRTNQMNFSSNRYTREEVGVILGNKKQEKYVLSASDRFGDYGIIGFAVIEKDSVLITDMLFSCRIQMKRIEHAFLCYILRRYKQDAVPELSVIYRPTKTNSHCAKVFDDLGFEQKSQGKNREIFTFNFKNELPNEDIVTVSET